MEDSIKLNSTEITCAECSSPCDLNTEYEGSAVCCNKECIVHNE